MLADLVLHAVVKLVDAVVIVTPVTAAGARTHGRIPVPVHVVRLRDRGKSWWRWVIIIEIISHEPLDVLFQRQKCLQIGCRLVNKNDKLSALVGVIRQVCVGAAIPKEFVNGRSRFIAVVASTRRPALRVMLLDLDACGKCQVTANVHEKVKEPIPEVACCQQVLNLPRMLHLVLSSDNFKAGAPPEY